jgi:WD40 repeat protein
VPDPRRPGFAWSPADGSWYAASAPGRLARFHGTSGVPDWECQVDPVTHIFDVAVNADGTRVAAAARNDSGLQAAGTGGAGNVAVTDERGSLLRILPGGHSPVFFPAGPPLLAVPEPGADPHHIFVYDLADYRRVATRQVKDGIGRLAWSPDGSLLAMATGKGRVIIWRTNDWNRVQAPLVDGSAALIARIAWSPDGRYLAVTPAAGGAAVTRPTCGSDPAVDRTFARQARYGPHGGRCRDARALAHHRGSRAALDHAADAPVPAAAAGTPAALHPGALPRASGAGR